MPSSDTLQAQKAATAAEVAAATAKLYSQAQETYADDAAASATEASASAQSASDSASLAQQYYSLSLDGVLWFVGSYAAAPTERSNGTALEVGDMYKNTTDNEVYSFNSDGTWSSMNSDATLIQNLYSSGEDLFTHGSEMYDASMDIYDATFSTIENSDQFAGSYEDGPLTITSVNRWITYNGTRWYVKPGTTVPFTTSGLNATSWETDSANFAEVGDAALRQELASDSGASMIGTPTGQTVQERLDESQQKSGVGGDDVSEEDILRNSGQYEINPEPEDLQAVAALTFGGKNNKATLWADNRGRLAVSAVSGCRISAHGIRIPFSEGTGYWRGQYQDTFVRFPADGQADDDKTHGIIFSYDPTSGLPIIAVVSPKQYAGTGAFNFNTSYQFNSPLYRQVRELAQLDSIGRSMKDSFDAWYLYNNSGIRYHKMATISNASSTSAVNFTGILTIGNWYNKTVSTYALSVSGQGLGTISNITRALLSANVKLTNMNGSYLEQFNSGNSPSVGLRMTSTGVAEVWIRIPANGKLLSYQSLNSGNRDAISFSWDALNTRYTDIISSEPANVMWKNSAINFTSDNCVMTNDGAIRPIQGGGVIRVGNENVFTQRGDIVSNPFVKGGTYHSFLDINSNMESITVSFDSSTNIYTVTGVGVRWDTFRIIPPKDPYSSLIYGVKLESSASGTFSFSVRPYIYTVSGGSVTQSLGDAIPIPDYTWVDASVQW